MGTISMVRVRDDIKHVGRALLGRSGQLAAPLVRPMRKIGQPRSHHCPLAFVQVPAPQIEADNVGDRIVAVVERQRAIDASELRCAIAIAPVEDLAIKQNCRLADLKASAAPPT